MKLQKLIFFAVLSIVYAGMNARAFCQEYKEILYPDFNIAVLPEYSNFPNTNAKLNIMAIRLYKDSTVMDMEYLFRKNSEIDLDIDQTEKIWYPNSKMECGYDTLKIIAYRGIELNKDSTRNKEIFHKAGECGKFTLVFGSLPQDVASMDFIGGPHSTLFDINLTKSNTYKTQSIGKRLLEEVIVLPKFLGLNQNFFTQWTYSRLKYPEPCRKEEIEGKVIMRIIIDKQGKASFKALEFTDIRFVQAVMNVVKKSPDWTPGSIHGVPLKFAYNFPINFLLR